MNREVLDPELEAFLEKGPEPSSRELTVAEREAFLAGRQLAVLSVTADAGRPPLAVPIWYSYEPGGNITFLTGVRGIKVRKTRLIKQAGMVSIVVQRSEQPYRQVTVEGTVVRIDQPPTAEQMVAIARRYLPDDIAEMFAETETARAASEGDATRLVHFTVRPDRWLTMTY